MTALAAERDTKRRNGDQASYPLAAAAKVLAGAIACISTATGYATKGATSTTLKAVGVAEETADNTNGAAGDVRVKVRRDGWFLFANSASTDALTLADCGADAYLVDDQTVAKTSGSATRSVAGKVRDIDTQGVWIEFV